MIFIKESTVLIFLILLVEARNRFEIRNETRKSMSSESQKNFDSTVQGLKRLSRLQRRLFGMKNRKDTNDDNVEEASEDPMANPDLFEGDVILTENQVNKVISNVIEQAEEKNIDVSDIENKTDILLRKKREMTKNPDFEWTFPIPYYVDNGVDAAVVEAALAGIEAETCIRFTRSLTPITDKAGLRYFKGNGCYSYIGRIFEKLAQDVSIGQGCGFHGIVQHETSHALGVKHEQSRTDRDVYVTIYPENITPGKEGNFVKNSADAVLNYGIPYDYGSVMHYKKTAFSNNGKDTIVPTITRYDTTMGQYSKVSFNDMKLLNAKYCSTVCPSQITCNFGGFQNPNNCGFCRYPSFIVGKSCQHLGSNTAPECGAQFLTATTSAKQFKVSGAINCYYSITVGANQRIKLVIDEASLPNANPCYSGRGLEIKFKNDKSLTGFNFCGTTPRQVILSQGDTVLLHYVGTLGVHYATLSYIQY